MTQDQWEGLCLVYPGVEPARLTWFQSLEWFFTKRREPLVSPLYLYRLWRYRFRGDDAQFLEHAGRYAGLGRLMGVTPQYLGSKHRGNDDLRNVFLHRPRSVSSLTEPHVFFWECLEQPDDRGEPDWDLWKTIGELPPWRVMPAAEESRLNLLWTELYGTQEARWKILRTRYGSDAAHVVWERERERVAR